MQLIFFSVPKTVSLFMELRRLNEVPNVSSGGAESFRPVNHHYEQGRTGHRENRENSRWPGSQLFFFFMLLFLPAECILK